MLWQGFVIIDKPWKLPLKKRAVDLDFVQHACFGIMSIWSIIAASLHRGVVSIWSIIADCVNKMLPLGSSLVHQSEQGFPRAATRSWSAQVPKFSENFEAWVERPGL